MFLTVDLASKFSAAILRDDECKVRWQGDSAGVSSSMWVNRLGVLVESLIPHTWDDNLHVVIEDVPYGISSQAMVKPVLRLQGMLIHEIGGLGVQMYFVNPATWQKEYPGVGRAPAGMSKSDGAKYRITKAEEYARALGYEAPDLVQEYIDSLPPGTKVLKKNTAPLEKNMTDYRDAFLMNDWLVRHKEDYRTLSGVQIAMI